MESLFRTLASYLVTEKCYETYIYDNNFFDGMCASMVVRAIIQLFN